MANMNGLLLTNNLKVELADPMDGSSGSKTARVQYGTTDTLDISLRRTPRTPPSDNSGYSPLDCGPFPIYSV